MDRRALLAAVAVGLTAGCSSERLPGGSGETTAPPADSEWTTENGLDVSALVDTHVTALTEAGSYSGSRRKPTSWLQSGDEADTEESHTLSQSAVIRYIQIQRVPILGSICDMLLRGTRSRSKRPRVGLTYSHTTAAHPAA
jgi:hypothetical protein